LPLVRLPDGARKAKRSSEVVALRLLLIIAEV